MLKPFWIWLDHFCENLEATPLSQAIQTIVWVIPTVQIIHIVGIAAVMGSAFMLNARVAGLVDRDEDAGSVARRFLPVIWWTLPVLLATGAVMIIGEPGRALKNPVFHAKVALILVAMAHLWFCHRRLLAGTANAAAVVLPSIVLWLGIVFCGRWIAYF